MTTPKATFEEKILYKTHQHWIIPVINSLKLIIVVSIPLSTMTYFVSGYSWLITGLVFIIISGILAIYDHYLWHHSCASKRHTPHKEQNE